MTRRISTPAAHLLPLLTALAPLACSDDGAADPDTTTVPPETTGTSDLPTTDTPTSTTDTTSTTTVDPTTTTTPDPTTTTGETATSSSTTDTTDTTATDTTGAPLEWQPPACNSVTGTGAVTFSHDEGATLAPMDQQIVPVTYTFGLVALGEPGHMLAGTGSEILASDDAGCSWHSIGPAGGPNTPAVRLVAAGQLRAYAFGDNDSVLLRVDDEVITMLKAPGGQNGVVGLGVDPQDPDHVRLGDAGGQVWDSPDAGATWNPHGIPAPGVLTYRFAFDPQNIDHIVAGVVANGVQHTVDGALLWQKADGLGPGDANAFNLVVSPATSDVVWVEGLDLEDPNEATARHIWRSDDGGLTFLPVVNSDDATLYNGNHLFAHPTDPDILYFVFGSNFQGAGTDLYRYDHDGGTLTMTHNMWHDTVITFLPGDPTWIYLGLSIEP